MKIDEVKYYEVATQYCQNDSKYNKKGDRMGLILLKVWPMKGVGSVRDIKFITSLVQQLDAEISAPIWANYSEGCLYEADARFKTYKRLARRVFNEISARQTGWVWNGFGD